MWNLIAARAARLGLCLAILTAVVGRSGGVRAAGVGTLPTGASTVVIAFGLAGGNPADGTYMVSIYGDGHIWLKKSAAAYRRDLTNPKLRLDPYAMRGLLRLAKAERFFSMPALTKGKGVVTEASTALITIRTTAGKKTVGVLGVLVERFDELFSVLVTITGLAV